MEGDKHQQTVKLSMIKVRNSVNKANIFPLRNFRKKKAFKNYGIHL